MAMATDFIYIELPTTNKKSSRKEVILMSLLNSEIAKLPI